MQKIAWDITWDNLGAKDLFAGGSQAQSGHSLLRCICLLLTQSGHWTTVQLDIGDHISENRPQRRGGVATRAVSIGGP